jgi:hypothetical protein
MIGQLLRPPVTLPRPRSCMCIQRVLHIRVALLVHAACWGCLVTSRRVMSGNKRDSRRSRAQQLQCDSSCVIAVLRPATTRLAASAQSVRCSPSAAAGPGGIRATLLGAGEKLQRSKPPLPLRLAVCTPGGAGALGRMHNTPQGNSRAAAGVSRVLRMLARARGRPALVTQARRRARAAGRRGGRAAKSWPEA